jgi:hypothetical protein
VSLRGSAGVNLRVWYAPREMYKDLGGPNNSLKLKVSRQSGKRWRLKIMWDSDQLIVLRGRESRSHACADVLAQAMGKGLTVVRSQQCNINRTCRTGYIDANQIAGDSE